MAYTFPSLDELQDLIDRKYFEYLSSEKKDEKRQLLDNYMREFLCRVPHNRKFQCSQTAEVLRRSVFNRQDFNGLNAARAFGALAKYADNLFYQPWRKEFREIKLYCGFYKHEVEEFLVGAEQMLEAMGYKHAGHSTMAFPGVLDPDLALIVSKDAMLAVAECLIMNEIWELMTPHQITWVQILEFRENHVCSPKQAIRGLTYKVNERRHQQMPHRQQQVASCNYTPYYHPMHHAAHSYSASRYAQVVSPQIAPPPPMCQSNSLLFQHQTAVLKPHEVYPSNGYNVHNAYPNVSYPPYNGCSMHNYAPPRPVVPTGQLIQLNHDPCHVPHYPVPDSLQNAEFLSRKAKDDGAGPWENWQEVLRNVENQGYRKDPVSSGEGDYSDQLRALNLNTSGRNKSQQVPLPKRCEEPLRTEGDGEAKQRLRKNSTDVEETVPKQKNYKYSLNNNCDDSGYKCSKTVIDEVDTSTKKKINKISNINVSKSQKAFEREIDNNLSVVDSTHLRRTPELVKISPTRPKSPDMPIRTRSPELPEQTRVVTLDISQEFLREVSPVVNLPPENGKWECTYCTFLNSYNRNICEMCHKSKNGDTKPQPSGGSVCQNCTFVNEKGKNFCAACNNNLKGSANYV